MKVSVYADTSLLASLYLADANTPHALRLVAGVTSALMLTSWQEFELENAFQLRLFRRESTRADLDAATEQMSEDIAAGVVVRAPLPVASIMSVARQLAARHTAVIGCRAFDVFHVAAALHLGARRFLSFDRRQLALARAAGLRAAPKSEKT